MPKLIQLDVMGGKESWVQWSTVIDAPLTKRMDTAAFERWLSASCGHTVEQARDRMQKVRVMYWGGRRENHTRVMGGGE